MAFDPEEFRVTDNFNPALVGADNHNIGNQGSSWFDPTTWGDSIGNAGKFLAASAISGANSYAQTAVSVVNFFGADAKVEDTQAWATYLDNDLGAYYAANKQSADVAGFILGNFVPGLAGVKVLNAGQSALRAASTTGWVGRNLSRYTGILAPSTENYVALAANELRASQAASALSNINTLKALGAGVWQNTLEGAAFEVFATAAQSKSPVLSELDNWDIAKNIVVGGALGGVIGGGISAARSFKQLKDARLAEDFRLRRYNDRELQAPGTSDSDSILLRTDRRDELLSRAIDPSPLGPNPTALERATWEQQKANSLSTQRKMIRDVDNENRQAMHSMSGQANKDKELINEVADSMVAMDSKQALANFGHATQITRPGTRLKELDEAIDAGSDRVHARYVELHGENRGRINVEKPSVMSLADTVKLAEGQSTKDAVDAVVKSYRFNPNKLWDPLANTHKAGASAEAEARYAYTSQQAKPPADMLVHENDIPMLERMLQDKRVDFTLVGRQGKTPRGVDSPAQLEAYIKERKQFVADELMRRRIEKLSLEEGQDVETLTASISKIVNVEEGTLSGTIKPDGSGWYAWQDLTKSIHQDKLSKGLASANDAPVPSFYVPKVAKIYYSTPAEMADGHIIDALTLARSQQLLLQQGANNVAAKQMGSEIFDQLPELAAINRANSAGAGAGFVRSVQAGYGTVESEVQQLGKLSQKLQQKLRTEVDGQAISPLYNLKNNQAAAIEWSEVNRRLSNLPEHYAPDVDNVLGYGPNNLVPAKWLKAAREAKDGEPPTLSQLGQGVPTNIPVQNSEAWDTIIANLGLTQQRTINRAERFAADGKLHQYDPSVVRPISPNPKQFSHFAFVKDPKVTGAGHSSMLFATSERELEGLIAKTSRDHPDLNILTKRDTADWHKARQEYEYAEGINENYIDASLKRTGAYSNFYTPTDPAKITDEILQFHYRAADMEAKELVQLRYKGEFEWLNQQARSHGSLETSQFRGGNLDRLEQESKNPYISYQQTALNIHGSGQSRLWQSLNRTLDEQVSRAVGVIRGAFDTAKSPAEIEAVNGLMSRYGIQTSFNSASEAALVNHTAPKAELSRFVRTANSVMSRFTLGFDPLNALNNAIGANVLRVTELTQLTRGIKAGNPQLAGALSQLAEVKVPGVDATILSPTKLMANSFKRFWGADGDALIAEYKSQGFISDRMAQFRSMSDDIALKGTETVTELQSRSQRLISTARGIADKGEIVTGNKLAEEWNRFVSADVMRQITDLGQAAGILTKQESLAYINNFVNRVEGNVIASQRPGLFQGAVGQALGLFQSYQFNMLQNFLRYTTEGSGKDVAMLLGLQGTLYGLQGEPGFKFINDHIVGTLSGNRQHRDIYDVTRGIAGKEGGDWLLYGIASNLTQTNIYSRGDINPRNLTIVPTNIADVPFVGGMGKLFAGVFGTAKQIAGGGDVVETVRSGLEHNGIFRPLAGLAQVSRGFGSGPVFSTSSNGNILGQNDLLSWASLSRLAGGRPLDEAIQNDTMFSINSYEAVDRAKKKDLAKIIKSQMVGGGMPDGDEVQAFAAAYGALGGKQGSFSKYMMEQYNKANTPQAQLLSQKLNNPLTYKLQQLMGGEYGQ